MKVIIVGTSMEGGGFEKVKKLNTFLKSVGHQVEVISLPGQMIAGKAWYYYQHARARLGGYEERHMKKTADFLEKRVRKMGCDALICVETSLSYVLTRDLSCLKIFSCESLEADELYFSKSFGELERVRRFRGLELEIMQKSDYVVFPWKTTENYVRKYIWNGDNFVTIKYGCYPQNKIPVYFFPVSIISLGNVGCYWSNPELLSYLTRISPYVIDIYGKNKPHRKYHLNYRGYASSLDVLKDYQFGLNTVSKDIFRRNHHSSRILSYLAYGLPVLSPDWLQFSHELKGVLPFNEDNFLEIIERYSDPDEWAKISKDAYEQALELDWKKVLLPLEKILATVT